MSSKSNDNGRALEYCLTEYILKHSQSNITVDSSTKSQQSRDKLKYDSLPQNLKDNFDRASSAYFFTVSSLNIQSLKRLDDSQGKNGNPTDIELTFIENNIEQIKNISLKNNHSAVKHQRPGALISQLGVSDSEKAQYKESIKSIERLFISEVEKIGLNPDEEICFSAVKAKNTQLILCLYQNVCTLVMNTINNFSITNAKDYFHFLVSRNDFEKVIVSPDKLLIEEWHNLPEPTSMNASIMGNGYILLQFDNSFSFTMRLHTASSKFKKGSSLSLKFDTQLSEVSRLPKVEIFI